MNTEENKNKAAAKLKGLYDGAVHMREAKVCLLLEDAAGVLEYIEELESKVDGTEELVVGDTVEVLEDSTDSVGDSPYRGRRGTLVNIEGLAKSYPYSVQFVTGRGGKSILYFSRAELKKVV